ncbi:MAG: hypothetical protein WCJ72_05325 [Chryseobacterium sp.]
MKKEILKKVLQLDSLTGFLDWVDRAEIHLYRDNAKIASKRVLAAYEWIIKENWEAPQMKYGHDRVLYFYDPDSETWLPDEYYLKLYPQYKQELTKLKYV